MTASVGIFRCTAIDPVTGDATWAQVGVGATPTAQSPGAPTNVTATAQDAAADVSWTAPADPGTSPITSYTVTSTPGGKTATVQAPATSVRVVGLTDGTAYSFTVHATSADGVGAESTPSNTVTPQPSGPTVNHDSTDTGVFAYYDTQLGRTLTAADLTKVGNGGAYSFSAPGTYKRLDIHGYPHIDADGVILEGCRWTVDPNVAKPRYVVTKGSVSGRAPRGFEARYCTGVGGGYDGTPGTISGWGPSALFDYQWGYVADHCDLSGSTDVIKPQDNPPGETITFTDNYVHDLVVVNPGTSSVSHNDFVQIAGSGGHDLIIRRNTVIARSGPGPAQTDEVNGGGTQFGSFVVNQVHITTAVLQNIDIGDNFIDGVQIGWRMAFSTSEVQTCQNVAIHDNRLGLNIRSAYTASGTGQDGGRIAWYGNTWAYTGTTAGGQQVTAGQAIP